MSFGDPNMMDPMGIKAGMDVVDSEHHKIGKVQQVYFGTPYGEPPPRATPPIIEPYLRIDTGRDELFVPSSSVMNVTDDELILNVLSDRIDEMGWSERPEFIEG